MSGVVAVVRVGHRSRNSETTGWNVHRCSSFPYFSMLNVTRVGLIENINDRRRTTESCVYSSSQPLGPPLGHQLSGSIKFPRNGEPTRNSCTFIIQNNKNRLTSTHDSTNLCTMTISLSYK